MIRYTNQHFSGNPFFYRPSEGIFWALSWGGGAGDTFERINNASNASIIEKDKYDLITYSLIPILIYEVSY